MFRQWQSHMPAQVQVCSVQLPGRENRMNEQACLVLSHLVERIFTGLYHLFDVPFAFFGHSLGAKIAFELARCAQQNKLPLRCLLVAASRAPHIREPRPLHHLPDQLFLQELRRYSATPEALLANQELMAVFCLFYGLISLWTKPIRSKPVLHLPVLFACMAVKRTRTSHWKSCLHGGSMPVVHLCSACFLEGIFL